MFDIIFDLKRWSNTSCASDRSRYSRMDTQNLWKNLKWYGLNTLAQVLNLHQLFVNITSFLTNFSSDSKYGSRKIIDFCWSYNHSGIIRSTLFLLKYSMVFLIKLIKTFFMPCTSFSKSVAFLSIHQLWDYVYTWSDFPRPVCWKFFWLTVNFVSISHPLLINSVSKNSFQ